MTCLPLFSCLLLCLHLQVFCFTVQPKPNISCVVFNLTYVHCNWTRPPMAEMNYTFSTVLNKSNESKECPKYLQENGQNVGCKIPIELDRFASFDTKLSMGGNLLVTKEYDRLGEIVKLNPPYNLSLNWQSAHELCLSWMNQEKIKECVISRVRYRRGNSSEWKVSETKELSKLYCVSSVSTTSVYTFQVQSNLKKICLESNFWSEWSEPIQWQSNIESSTASQAWWQVAVIISAAILLIAFASLLCYFERSCPNRVKLVFLPVVPDPRKNLQDLFHSYNGNVESWVYFSSEMKQAFDSDYTENPCVACELSAVDETKSGGVPVQEPSS